MRLPLPLFDNYSNHKVISIEEKPPKSIYVVTDLYCYNSKCKTTSKR
jgi:dTDP-glucose pyrophosphorylase